MDYIKQNSKNEIKGSKLALLLILQNIPNHRHENKQIELAQKLSLSREVTNQLIKSLEKLGLIRLEKLERTLIKAICLTEKGISYEA